jgi:hypothetical protein
MAKKDRQTSKSHSSKVNFEEARFILGSRDPKNSIILIQGPEEASNRFRRGQDTAPFKILWRAFHSRERRTKAREGHILEDAPLVFDTESQDPPTSADAGGSILCSP